MILPITAYGHPILRQKTTEAENTPETRQLILDMKDTLANTKTGIGLASNQVGSDKSIFLSRVGRDIMVHINATIIKRRGKQTAPFEEGCLSIVGVYENVPERDDIIEIISYDENFNKRRIKLKGIDSRVYQHELEHNLGILFIDHLTADGRERIKEQLLEIEKGKIQVHYDMIFSPQAEPQEERGEDYDENTGRGYDGKGEEV